METSGEVTREQPAADPNQDEGSARRVERCFERHHGAIFRYALRRTGDPTTAEDVAAEVFSVVWRRRGDLPTDELPWLYGVARRVIANRARLERRAVRLQAAIAAEGTGGGTQSVEGAVLEADTVRRALDELPARDRELLMLLAWEGLDRRQAAVALGCSIGALRVRLLRARRRLERTLRDHEDELAKEGRAAEVEV